LPGGAVQRTVDPVHDPLEQTLVLRFGERLDREVDLRERQTYFLTWHARVLRAEAETRPQWHARFQFYPKFKQNRLLLLSAFEPWKLRKGTRTKQGLMPRTTFPPPHAATHLARVLLIQRRRDVIKLIPGRVTAPEIVTPPREPPCRTHAQGQAVSTANVALHGRARGPQSVPNAHICYEPSPALRPKDQNAWSRSPRDDHAWRRELSAKRSRRWVATRHAPLSRRRKAGECRAWATTSRIVMFCADTPPCKAVGSYSTLLAFLRLFRDAQRSSECDLWATERDGFLKVSKSCLRRLALLNRLAWWQQLLCVNVRPA